MALRAVWFTKGEKEGVGVSLGICIGDSVIGCLNIEGIGLGFRVREGEVDHESLSDTTGVTVF